MTNGQTVNSVDQSSLVAMVIDDDENVLSYVSAVVRNIGYSVSSFSSSQKAIDQLHQIHPSLVITDLLMPVVDGFTVLSSVLDENPEVAVIMLTGQGDIHLAVEAMKRGASDYVSKPFEPDRLASAIVAARARKEGPHSNGSSPRSVVPAENGLELDSLRRQVQSSTSETVHALIAALDVRERETNQHSLRVSAYASHLAEEMGVSGDELIGIQRGALLHDIGKIGIADSILLKPGPLTPDEWVVMKTHPELGYRIVNGLGWLKGGDGLVLYHHERFEGGGYPHGLVGLEIPFEARIFSVIDTFDALTTNRPYREARGYSAAITEIRRCSGTQFDPDIVSAFCEVRESVWDFLAQTASERATRCASA